jgi:hypothetical protein
MAMPGYFSVTETLPLLSAIFLTAAALKAGL